MTTQQIELDYPSAPIAGDTKATVKLVGHDWLADGDWRRFTVACVMAAYWDYADDTTGTPLHGGYLVRIVSPDNVRSHLTDDRGELTINPRRLSAFYSRAAGKNGFLDFSHWGISEDTKGRNAGKPCRIYKMRPTPSGSDAATAGMAAAADTKPSEPEANPNESSNR